MEVVPYKEQNSGKKEQVQQMFDNIAPRYDFLNRFLSAGIDILWRKKLIAAIVKYQPAHILDVATGTGDVAIEMTKVLKPKKITGIDLSGLMLNIAGKKVKELGLENKIELLQGDSENLPFGDNNFDAVTVAFGVRNFENLEKGLNEIKRVLKPGAPLAVLEFSKPRYFPVKNVYNIYFRYILPVVGRLISKDSSAYTYLPESVENFPQDKEFLLILEKLGYRNCQCTPLTFGISSIYTAQKPA